MAQPSSAPDTSRRLAATRRPAVRPGLTLIEVLVVLVIIGILATLTVSVAARVSGAGKGRLTQDAIRVLDMALTGYVSEKGANPPPVIRDPRDAAGRHLIPVADARNVGATATADQTILNSGGFFVYQAQTAGLSGLFSSLDTRVFSKYDADSTENQFLDANGNVLNSIDQFAAPGTPGGPSSAPTYTNQPRIPTVLDGWGRPIRYVHPTFGGVLAGSRLSQSNNPANPTRLDSGEWDDLKPGAGLVWSFPAIRRNNQKIDDTEADSDGGRPVGGRPYFYSAGPDGDPSTIDDNIYSVRPDFVIPR
jgi:prepilin-type N-terminal cleavage/methylation domain-containing protein